MADKNIQSIYTLTPLQEGILFHSLESPDSRAYFNQLTCRIHGQLDCVRMQRAWEAVFARHDALRTLFTWENRQRPLQIVRRHVELPFEVLDWQNKDPERRTGDMSALLQSDRAQGFDLGSAPLSRLRLIQFSADTAQLVWSFHHILLDGWSVRRVLDEVMEEYRAAGDGTGGIGPQTSFEAFVSWQKGRDRDSEKSFWKQRLDGFSAPISPEFKLSGDGSDTRDGSAGQQSTARLDGRRTRELLDFAGEHKVTMNSVVVAAWAILLSRFCDSRDMVFGTTVSGRACNLDGIEHIVGLVINTLPLRVKMDAGLTIPRLLRELRNQHVDQQAFEQTPLPDIRRYSEVDTSVPLFETVYVFENVPEMNTGEIDGLRLSDVQFIEHSNFPLALLVMPGGELEFILVHDGRRYSRGSARQILRSLDHILLQIVDEKSLLVDEISVVPPEDVEQLLSFGSGKEIAPAEGLQSVVQLFERTAARFPDSVALAAEGDVETYDSLNRKANRLARRLLDDHEAGKSPVIIFATRSTHAIVGMLAALKCGAVYVPMDVNEPAARLRQVALDLAQRFTANVTVRPLILTEAEFLGDMPDDIADVALLGIDEPTGADGNLEIDFEAHDLAYIIYTSGSTGEPKGVMVHHGALLNSNLARFEFYDDRPDSFALVSSLATDSSLAGIYWTLCAGGKLVLPPSRTELDVEQLAALIQEHGVSHMLCVPSLYALILENADTARLRTLRSIIVAGDACHEALVTAHETALPGARLFNEYGPSETCVWATAAELESGPVSIGGAIANTTVYVLDSRQRPVPAGITGELYVGGANVATGYLGRPEATAAAFLENPFAADGSRMYRTGDRARFWEDGRLEFLGRSDHQLKIRGYRIEAGEVEARLCEHPGVDEAVVYKHPTGPGDSLVAVVAGDIGDQRALREFCEEKLPRHMVPQRIVVLDGLPKTRAGKTDRDAVESMVDFDDAQPTEGSAVEPRTPQEEILAAIWRDVIGVDEIFVFDNFFELGGDSLMTIRILSRASREGVRITPEQFFENPTIAGQAGLVEATTDRAADEDEIAGPLPLLPIQQWFFRKVRTCPQHWNYSYLFEIDRNVSTQQLDRAIAELLQKHAALRTQFSRTGSHWSATIPESASIDIESADLSSIAPEMHAGRIEDIAKRLNASIDLETAPALRACHFLAGNSGPNYLLIVIHHLLADVESWRTIIEDLELMLVPDRADALSGRGTSGHSISQWARALQSMAEGSDLDADREYWTTLLSGVTAALPADVQYQPGGSNRECDTVIHSYTVDHSLRERIASTTTGPFRTSMYQMLLSAVARASSRWANLATVVIDTEGHGRESVFPGSDVTSLVGWLTSVYPMVLKPPESTWNDAVASLRYVKEYLGKIPRNGISFGILRDLAGPGNRTDAIAAYDGADILFNYLGEFEVSGGDGSMLKLVDRRCGPVRDPSCERAYPIEINSFLYRGELIFDIVYSKELFTGASIDQLESEITQSMTELADGISTRGASTMVAADFPLAKLSDGDLDSVAGQLDALEE